MRRGGVGFYGTGRDGAWNVQRGTGTRGWTLTVRRVRVLLVVHRHGWHEDGTHTRVLRYSLRQDALPDQVPVLHRGAESEGHDGAHERGQQHGRHDHDRAVGRQAHR